MQEAVGEATAAYNSDVHSLIQLVTGRIPHAPGDVLNGIGRRLAEHSLISSRPSMARQTGSHPRNGAIGNGSSSL